MAGGGKTAGDKKPAEAGLVVDAALVYERPPEGMQMPSLSLMQ